MGRNKGGPSVVPAHPDPRDPKEPVFSTLRLVCGGPTDGPCAGELVRGVSLEAPTVETRRQPHRGLPASPCGSPQRPAALPAHAPPWTWLRVETISGLVMTIYVRIN